MSEAAFLAAIRNDPADDTPRLVFADWLEEHGQPVRAAFVRDQIALAKTDDADPRYPELLARTRRCGVLTDASHRLECERGVTGAMFRRGFVAGVEGVGYDLPACDALPVEQLHLRTEHYQVTGDIGPLLERPELGRIHTLALGSAWDLGALDALLTGGCPQLAGLRALSVGESREEAAGLWDVIARAALPALDSFALDFGIPPRYDDEDYEPTPNRDWSGFLPPNALRRLHLTGVDDTHSEWEWPGPDYNWLIESARWPALEVADVTLYANPISGTDYVEVMPPGLLFKRLAKSRLARLTINGSNLDRLLAAPDWGNVRSLAVHDRFNAAQLSWLFTHPQAQKLEHLTLCGDHVWHDRFDFGNLPDVIRTPGLLPKLRRLSVRSELAALANGSYRDHLLWLDVGTKGVFGEGWPALLKVPFPRLHRLTLDGFRGEQELEGLFTTENMPNLCTLRVGYFQAMSEDTLGELARNPAMPHLSLVGVGSPYDEWRVLATGEDVPVVLGTLPLDEDWWEPDPLATWFW